MSEERQYTIEFWKGNRHSDEDANLSQLFHDIEDQGPGYEIGSYTYQIRDLEVPQTGNIIKGYLGKFRTEDIPHAGSLQGEEWEIELEDDEGLIEKNYFLFYQDRDLLVYQRNGHGSTPHKLADYLSEHSGDRVIFDPVLQYDAVERLMRGEARPKKIELSFSRPTNPNFYPSDDWSRSMVGALGAQNGQRMFIRISGDGRSPRDDVRFLGNQIKDIMRNWARSEDIGVAKVVTEEENGFQETIDLVADRLISYQTAQVIGRYPVPNSMYGALRSAYREHRTEIERYFGDPDEALD